MKPALFALSAFLSVMLISGCQKKQEPGKTVVTGYGTVYTVQMIGNRNYHHSSQVRQPNGSLLFTNLPDTTFSFQYVNDGEVMFGADHLFFSISNSFNTNVVYKNLNIDQSMHTSNLYMHTHTLHTNITHTHSQYI